MLEYTRDKSWHFIIVLGMLMVPGYLMAGQANQKVLTPAMVEQIDLANKLIAYGDAKGDPILLIAAVRIMKSISQDSPGMKANSNAEKDVLSRARKLAQGRKDILGMVDDLEAMKSKGLDRNVYCFGGDCSEDGLNATKPM